MFRLFENSLNSLVESDIFRQEKDETCHIPVEVRRKADVVEQDRDEVRQISIEVSKKAGIT